MPARKYSRRRTVARGGLYQYPLDMENGWSFGPGKQVPWPSAWRRKYGLAPHEVTTTLPPYYYTRGKNRMYINSQVPMDFAGAYAKNTSRLVPRFNAWTGRRGVRLGTRISKKDSQNYTLGIDPGVTYDDEANELLYLLDEE